MPQNMADELLDAIDEKKNPSVVGLDPRIGRVPEHIKKKAKERASGPFEAVKLAFIEFNKGIIDSVKDIVPAVKPQMAFYEKFGSQGVQAMEKTIQYAKKNGLIVIEDIKRNDIGSTARAYAEGHMGDVEGIEEKNRSPFDADMLTVNAYLGTDGVEPFLKVCRENDKGIFILVKTSNPSSGELQDRTIEGNGKVYELMAEMTSGWGEELVGEWGYSSVGAVVGATYPEEAEKLRDMMKNNLLLVPGYGAQGGTADDVIPCFNDDGYGAIVNSSRGIDYAYEDDEEFGPKEFDNASRKAALQMKDDIMK